VCLATLLTQAGHDTNTVQGQRLRGTIDGGLYEFCEAEKCRARSPAHSRRDRARIYNSAAFRMLRSEVQILSPQPITAYLVESLPNSLTLVTEFEWISQSPENICKIGDIGR